MSADRGALAATRKVTRVVRGNVALIGDASGSIDPITGEGLRLAFRQALHLARALKAGVLESYQHAHSGLFRLPRLMSDFMLLMDRSHFLRRRTLAAFESHPHIFSNLLAMHAGKLPPIHFLSNAAELGWQVITA
jgi:flavin-dependent dehydrogenase